MAETVRASSLYLGGKKIAECSGGSVTVNTGSEVQIADGGAFAVTDGAITLEASFDCIIPVAGMQKDVVAVLLDQTYIKLAIPYAGKLLQAEGKMQSADLKWDQKAGTFTGSFKFVGLTPKLA